MTCSVSHEPRGGELASAAPPTVVVDRVEKLYRGLVAVAGITFEVNGGESETAEWVMSIRERTQQHLAKAHRKETHA